MARPSGKAAALLACAAALLTTPLVTGAAAAPAKGGAPISGMWVVQEDYRGNKLRPQPVLTPATKAMREKKQAAADKGYYRTLGNMLCLGGGGPALTMMNSPFAIMQDFGRVTFIFETETFLQPRMVYLRQKTQPENILPSANGHSIGHWEGATLVVDTVGFSGRSNLPGGVPASDQAHIVERYSLSKDGKVLTNNITMTDPVNLAQPWTTVIKYDRERESAEIVQVSCEPDFEAIKDLDLEALKDADPEVARFLKNAAEHKQDLSLIPDKPK